MGGFFERVPGSTQINGRFTEYAEWIPDHILADQVPDENVIQDLRKMADRAVRHGITSMQIFPSMSFERFVRLLDTAGLPVRVRAIPFSPSSPGGRDLSEICQLENRQDPSSMVTTGGIKWILDGTLLERGAALHGDYSDRAGWRGKMNFPPGEIDSMLQESLDLKQQLLLHCVGDQTIAAVLAAMEKRSAEINWNSRRLRIEHGDALIGDLVQRARKLGVIVVQNPSHFLASLSQRWGTGKQPLRSLIEAGIPVALGSDGPMNPFLNIMFAAIHPYNPKEAITREQAVRAYTHEAAFAEFTENDKSAIAMGQLADLAVLSRDIFTAPVETLPETSSVLTIVNGKIVYDAQVLLVV